MRKVPFYNWNVTDNAWDNNMAAEYLTWLAKSRESSVLSAGSLNTCLTSCNIGVIPEIFNTYCTGCKLLVDIKIMENV